MTERGVIVGVFGIAITLILTALFAPSDKAIPAFISFSVGALLLLGYLGYLLYHARTYIRVFSSDIDTFDFVKAQIIEACNSGGTVFSSYVLEDPHGAPDIVSSSLKEAKSPIHYHRLILIDDPDIELKWLSDFLSLNDCVNLTVSAHLVANQGRLVSRFIKKTIPYINVFLVKTDSLFSRSILLISLPRRSTIGNPDPYKFAIAIKNEVLVDLARKYFDNLFVSAGNLIREFRSIEQYQSWRTIPLTSQKTMSIVELVKECAETFPEIVHVGVFGSVALRLSASCVDLHSRECENDLDLLVIVQGDADMDKVKAALSSAIRKEHSDAHIEWSNESNEFYWIRGQYQVDVQIHRLNDTYYNDHPLLGCAVFANYYVLYSDAGKPVNHYISVPNNLMTRAARVDTCLNDSKFGVLHFTGKCGGNDNKIDPRRVISINTYNFAWAIAGARPYSYVQAFKFVEDFVQLDLSKKLCAIRLRNTQDTQTNQIGDLVTTQEYLELIREVLAAIAHE